MGDVHRPVDKRPDFPAMEQRVLERWREDRTFERSLAAREGGPSSASPRGRRPPTATPARTTSCCARSRTPTCATRRCAASTPRARPAGTATACRSSCEVERELGLNSKREIETYGIAAFNEKCRESNAHYIASWERMTERVGFWIDLDGAFRTGDPEYVESVWWSLHELWDRGPHLQGPQGRPLLPALRHRPLLARDGDGLRRHGGRDRDGAAAGDRAARPAAARATRC